jgi:hypothetical protein
MSRGDPLDPLPSTPSPGVYRHYKGHLYEVVGVVRHSEELTPYVLYRCLDEQGRKIDDQLWVRPHRMWSEPVEHQGRVTPRFAPVSAS